MSINSQCSLQSEHLSVSIFKYGDAPQQFDTNSIIILLIHL